MSFSTSNGASLFSQTTQLLSSDATSGVKLCEPRQLYSLQKELGPQQAPRWPSECQVAIPVNRVLNSIPLVREPYYKHTGMEPEPEPWGDQVFQAGGEVVYRYEIDFAAPYFSRSVIGGNPANLSESILKDKGNTLIFESRFESGNLSKALKVTDTFYELYLRPDLYTARHMQWYYFRVRNMKAGVTYRFSIVNLSKGDSLYCEGLRPLLYSEKEAELNHVGWKRCGQDVVHFKNDTLREGVPSYTLSFTIEFPHDNDTVYLAYCYPYTYTDLQDYLLKLQNDSVVAKFCKIRMLCRSLAGNSVHVLTITAPSEEEASDQKKPAIVLSARVHPGETPSSWMMKGVLDFLTSSSPVAETLRQQFLFKIIPMLNPDGVIVGNTRCSLAAKDLNRQYKAVSRECYPSVWHVKMLVRRLLEEREVAMYCDFHSHSRKHNIFLYGCENSSDQTQLDLVEQVFPLLLQKAAPEKFEFASCKFVVQKPKEGTGRVVMRNLGILHSYTLEASICGSTVGQRKNTHFSSVDYENMGKAFCETLVTFFNSDPGKERWINRIVQKLARSGSTAEDPVCVSVSEYSSDEDEDNEKRPRKHRSRRLSSIPSIATKSLRSKAGSGLSSLNVQMNRLNRPQSRSASRSCSPSPSPGASPRGPSPRFLSPHIDRSSVPSTSLSFRRKVKRCSTKSKLIRSLTVPIILTDEKVRESEEREPATIPPSPVLKECKEQTKGFRDLGLTVVGDSVPSEVFHIHISKSSAYSSVSRQSPWKPAGTAKMFQKKLLPVKLTAGCSKQRDEKSEFGALAISGTRAGQGEIGKADGKKTGGAKIKPNGQTCENDSLSSVLSKSKILTACLATSRMQKYKKPNSETLVPLSHTNVRKGTRGVSRLVVTVNDNKLEEGEPATVPIENRKKKKKRKQAPKLTIPNTNILE